jgi:hypothetical protein
VIRHLQVQKLMYNEALAKLGGSDRNSELNVSRPAVERPLECHSVRCSKRLASPAYLGRFTLESQYHLIHRVVYDLAPELSEYIRLRLFKG